MNLVVVGPSIKMGGIERSSSTLANTFSEKGFKITFIALFPQEHFYNLNSNIDFIEPSGNLNSRKLNLLRTQIWIRQLIKSINPDAILVFNYFYGAIVCLAVVGLKIDVFVSDRASPDFKWPWHISIYNNMVFSVLAPMGLIAQTEVAAARQRKFFGKRSRIKVIPNPVREVQVYPETIRERQILAVGRLSDILKGFDQLLEAYARIRNKEWMLVFAGGDGDGSNIQDHAISLGIGNRIRFLGKVRELDPILAQSGIFVIPSISEGFPNALCEAMAAGLPCISFDFVAGPREIITHGHDGLIVENGNIENLARTIDYLTSDPEERRRLGSNATKIRERLNRGKIADEYLAFIFGKNE